MSELNKWRRRIEAASPELALELADQMLGLQGKVEQETLQKGYIEALVDLTARAPGQKLVTQISERLEKVPAYQSDTALRESFAAAIAQLAPKLGQSAEAHSLCENITRLKGYGANQAMQTAYGEALYFLGYRATRFQDVVNLAAQMQAIPSFRDSADLQFYYAKLTCNATVLARSAQQCEKMVASLESLPFFAQDARIQEAHQKALRNQERHQKLEGKVETNVSPRTAGRIAAIAGGVVVVGLVAGQAFFGKSTTPDPTPTARVNRVLEMANKALETGDYNAASAYAKTFLDGAADEATRHEALLLLIEIHNRANEYDKSLEYYAQLSPEEVTKVVDALLASTQEAFEAKKYAEASQLATRSVGLFKLRPPSVETRKMIANVFEADQKLVQAAEIRENLGELDTAAKLLETANAYDKLLVLYPKMGPKYRPRWMALRRQQIGPQVAACEKELTSSPEKAMASANSCLQTLESIEGTAGLQARCWTVVAKASYQLQRMKEAVKAARTAAKLSPNADTQQRLKAYRLKDLLTVTEEDLLDTTDFEFPPGIKTSDRFTYVYSLTPKGYEYSRRRSTRTYEEALHQPPRDEIVPRLTRYHYSRERDNALHFSVTTYQAKTYSLDFSPGKLRQLGPGRFDEATSYPGNINNPGIAFQGWNSRYNSEGRFVVHEISWTDKQELNSFAADFLLTSGNERVPASYGRIRYNSLYK